MNALDPIRHAYGEAEGTPPAPGEPGHAEFRLLRSTRDVLDALPRERPDTSVLETVKTEAAARAHLPVLAAYGEAAPPAAGDPRHAEYTLLQGTREVLDRMPKLRPEVPVSGAVGAAARAAAALVPLRHAYGEAGGEPPGPGEPGYAEYALLCTTRDVLEALPQQRPDDAVLGAIRTASEAWVLRPVLAAYGEAEPLSAGDPRHTEYALLQSTREVLSRAPNERPDAAVIAAISAAARGVISEPVPAAPSYPASPRPAASAVPRPAADRPARARILPFDRLPAWVGTAAVLVIIATAGIWVLNERPTREPSGELVAQVGRVPDADDSIQANQAESSLPAQDGEAIAQATPPASTPSEPLVAAGRVDDVTPPTSSVPRPEASRQERPATFAAGADQSFRDASAASREASREAFQMAVPTAAWEAAGDVRLLSLRLQQMAETSEGLSWDAPPAPFGAPGALAGEQIEGVRAVGAGPAHIEVRMRTTPADRSNGQQPRR